MQNAAETLDIPSHFGRRHTTSPIDTDCGREHAKHSANTLLMDIWSSYWKGRRLSCVQSGHGIRYPEILEQLWREYFRLLDDHAVLLDIGTGNGAIAIVANDIARELDRAYEIHAADQSDIDPPAYLRGTGLVTDGIIFHANTPAEKTDFDDVRFDVITGQYALEYTNLEATVRELARLLKPGGRARFVLHKRGSRVYEQTQKQIRDLQVLRVDLQLLDKAREMMRAVYACESEGLSDNASRERMQLSRAAFFSAAKTLHEIAPHSAYRKMFSDVLKILAHYWNTRRQHALETFLERMDELELELSTTEQRHRAMCDSALDAEGIEQLETLFDEHGFTDATLRTVEDRDAGAVLGWDLALRKRQPGSP